MGFFFDGFGVEDWVGIDLEFLFNGLKNYVYFGWRVFFCVLLDCRVERFLEMLFIMVVVLRVILIMFIFDVVIKVRLYSGNVNVFCCYGRGWVWELIWLVKMILWRRYWCLSFFLYFFVNCGGDFYFEFFW